MGLRPGKLIAKEEKQKQKKMAVGLKKKVTKNMYDGYLVLLWSCKSFPPKIVPSVLKVECV